MHPGKNIGNTTWEYKNGTRKSKAQRKLNLARDVKNNRNGLYKYTLEKEDKANCIPSDGRDRDLLTTGIKKAEVLSKLLASVFTGNFLVCQVPESQGSDSGNEVPLIIGDQVQDYLRNLNVLVSGTW